MAKKNLQSLMSGIIGSEPQESSGSTQQNDSGQNPPNGVEPTPQNSERPLRGRPRMSSEKGKTRTTLVLPADMPRKLRYISLMENMLQQDIITEALNDYIDKWEAANGKINMPNK
ncbi:MAG: hypothetical protein NC095_06610 [Muribaculum sp.]|nr:hypothetical protein [Muribaculum sp.]